MKLIIDIPEEEYKRMKEQSMFGRVDIWKQAIQNGTPLDDVKAEIKEQKSKRALQDDDLHWYREGINDVLAIIDNIGKAESEDKNELS